jgi:hypothetical protein
MSNLNKARQHPFIELREIWEAEGFKNSVLENECLPHSRMFEPNNYGENRHKETGESLLEYTKRMKDEKPFWVEGSEYIPAEVSEADEARAIIKAATETPSPKTLGDLYRHFGPKQAEQIIKASGVDVARMKPGKSLKVADNGVTEVVEEKADAKSKNPWSKDYIGPGGKRGPNFTAQGALIKALGPEKAAAIARAARSYIGATKAYD